MDFSLREPILAPILANRRLSGILTAVAGLQLGFLYHGVSLWECPIFQATGIPCPGCGLSRATAAFLSGDWRETLLLHAFAPLFVLAFIFIVAAFLMPEVGRRRLINQITLFESRTGITAVLLLALMAYWLVRLLTFPQAFITLIAG